MLRHIQLVTRMIYLSSNILVQKVIYKNQLLKQNQSIFLRVYGYNESTQVKTTKRALIMSKREHKKKNPRKHLFVQSQQYKH